MIRPLCWEAIVMLYFIANACLVHLLLSIRTAIKSDKLSKNVVK